MRLPLVPLGHVTCSFVTSECVADARTPHMCYTLYEIMIKLSAVATCSSATSECVADDT
jgi:hypothetical protein